MYVATGIDAHVVVALQHGQQTASQVLLLHDVLLRLRVDGVVPHDDDPVFLRVAQRGVEPLQLRLHVLHSCVGIDLRVVAVTLDERRGVDAHHPHRCAFRRHHLIIIARRHHPSAAPLRVVDHRLCVAAILVVAAHGEPVDHQLGVRVDQLIVGHPQRVVDRLYAVEMVHIARCDDTFRLQRLTHVSHQFGYRLLVVIAVTSEVVGQIHRHVALQLLPVGRRLCRHHRCGAEHQ